MGRNLLFDSWKSMQSVTEYRLIPYYFSILVRNKHMPQEKVEYVAKTFYGILFTIISLYLLFLLPGIYR